MCIINGGLRCEFVNVVSNNVRYRGTVTCRSGLTFRCAPFSSPPKPATAYALTLSGIMRTFTIFLLLLSSVEVKAQLLESEKLLPGIKSATTKSFSGSGGGGYWTLEKLDELGRTISKDYYHRKELLAQEVYKYNQMNDKTLSVQTYDINNPSRMDSTITVYEYDARGTATSQKQTYSNRKDSSVYELTEIIGDTLKYSFKRSFYRPKTETIDTYSYKYSLVFNTDKQVVYREILDDQEATTEIIEYHYNQNGQRFRRIITRIPEPEHEIVYVGGPGSDDMRYEYSYYQNGLIKRMYCIIKGRKFKLAKYRYE